MGAASEEEEERFWQRMAARDVRGQGGGCVIGGRSFSGRVMREETWKENGSRAMTVARLVKESADGERGESMTREGIHGRQGETVVGG